MIKLKILKSGYYDITPFIQEVCNQLNGGKSIGGYMESNDYVCLYYARHIGDSIYFSGHDISYNNKRIEKSWDTFLEIAKSHDLSVIEREEG